MTVSPRSPRFLRSIALLCMAMVGLCASSGAAWAQSTDWAVKMFAESSHDFGVVAKGADTRFVIKVTNLYEEQVLISAVSSSCGCTSARMLDNTLDSLEESGLELVVDTKRFSHEKNPTVTVNIAKPFPAVVKIPVKVYIRTDVVLTPGAANFGRIDEGAGKSMTIDLAYAGRPNWNLRGVESPDRYVSATLSEASRLGGTVNYRITVKLDPSLPQGPVRSQLFLMTDDVQNPRIPVLVEGDVVPEFAVNPEVVSFGILTAGKPGTQNVVVRAGSGRPFSIEGIQCGSDREMFQTKLPQGERTVHVIPLTVLTPDEPGVLQETFELKIVGRTQPVRFSASGKIVGNEVSNATAAAGTP